MIVAVFSDVHANLHALEAMLEKLNELHVDAYWCLGDIVGRGIPDYVIDVTVEMNRLYERQKPAHRQAWLRGNHDMMVIGDLPLGYFDLDAKGSSCASFRIFSSRSRFQTTT